MKKAPSDKTSAADCLVLNLFAPGMSAIHRAGLGGLACTLKYIERAYQEGGVSGDDAPGGPWDDGQPPWEIQADQLTLRFGKAGEASNFFQRLFKIAFSIDRTDQIINLPGQYRLMPNTAIRADLQLGLTLTFLQHGKTRALAKEPSTASHDPEGDGIPRVVVEYRKCSGFKHQTGWQDLVSPKTGCLSSSTVGIEGPLNPGAVVRHNAFSAPTKIDEPVERLLPLYFALVGCIALPVNRGVGVLLIPEVEDLCQFATMRPFMTPRSNLESIVGGAADAALRLQVRMKIDDLGLTACHAVTLRPTPWASQQKSRVESIYIPVLRDHAMNVCEMAFAKLGPRVVQRTVKQTSGKGKDKVMTERQESFRADSVVRPFIADNLARGRRWYADFTRLVTAVNPATGKPFRNQISFEREGLHAMVTSEKAFDQEGEALVVKAVHEAIRQSLGRIREETDGENAKGLSQATKNRWERFRERLRLDLSGSKTEAHVRHALMDLFSRGGTNNVLRFGWETALPVIRRDWQLARDLGLLALASYAGKVVDIDEDAPQS